MTGDDGGSGGTSGEGGRAEAGSDGAGTGVTGGAGGGNGGTVAGEAGQTTAGGKTGSSGGAACPASDAGEGGESVGAWLDDPEMTGAPLCVPDCSRADYTPAERIGCDWVCPDASPVRADGCELRCNSEVVCGPGLYCARATQAYLGGYAENCISLDDEDSDDDDCGCVPMPESCAVSEADRPLCGQDRKTYASLCEAHRARTDLVVFAEEATCALDDDNYFKCGGVFCVRGSEYCTVREAMNDLDVERFDCVASPCAASGGCDCVLSQFPGREDSIRCEETEPGAIIVTGDFQ
jgi:hypothetical protein